MTDFIAHVMEEGKPSNCFRHEFQAKDYAEAIEFARSGIVQAYKDEKKTEVRNTIITLLLLNFDVPPKSWRLKMPSEEIEECPVPCGYCGGEGCVDSGGVDPQGRGIDIPCPSCKQEADEVTQRNQVIKRLEEIHSRFQDEVWGSLDKYSKKLGWGLTGIQPECWACLDSAVEELVKARTIIAEVRKAIHMPEESSDDNVPAAARMLMAGYEASQPPPRG